MASTIPRLVNDRLLLGLKGIVSDFEMATLRQRALEAQRTKAQRGELWMHLPVGLVYGPTGAIELDPDARVQHTIRLVLEKFDELGSTSGCAASALPCPSPVTSRADATPTGRSPTTRASTPSSPIPS